ncbi:MAG: 4Fe-4S binding protein [Anaerolineaceae bacterium]|nr:4Fe-4S binding protein [Anaerolineaceae bacterium]
MKQLPMPIINKQRCTRCGQCISQCPTQAVEMIDQYPMIVHPAQCTYCGICEEICPLNAVELLYTITVHQ